jgi:hypothetical protein
MQIDLRPGLDIRCAAASFTYHVIKNYSEAEAINQRFVKYDSLIKSRFNMHEPCRAGRSATDKAYNFNLNLLNLTGR